MVTLKQLTYYLDNLLEASVFKDYAPNGLQIEGRSVINTIITGVTASQALIDAAIEHEADALLVHHGFFWKNEPATIVGMKHRRIKSLIANDVSLLAYHLPLDAHLIYGNNIQLAKLLHINFSETFAVEPGLSLGFKGTLTMPVTGEHFASHLSNKLARQPFFIAGESPFIETIAWCTGAAQDYLPLAIEQGVDAFLTGEASERTVHIARENNIHFYAAGHHATERYGIKALGEHLSAEFDLNHYFIDIDNPI